MTEELDAKNIEKVNQLAESLKSSGLAMNMEEAVKKAKDIIMGQNRGENKNVEEIEGEMKKVEEELKKEEDENLSKKIDDNAQKIVDRMKMHASGDDQAQSILESSGDVDVNEYEQQDVEGVDDVDDFAEKKKVDDEELEGDAEPDEEEESEEDSDGEDNSPDLTKHFDVNK